MNINSTPTHASALIAQPNYRPSSPSHSFQRVQPYHDVVRVSYTTQENDAPGKVCIVTGILEPSTDPTRVSLYVVQRRGLEYVLGTLQGAEAVPETLTLTADDIRRTFDVEIIGEAVRGGDGRLRYMMRQVLPSVTSEQKAH